MKSILIWGFSSMIILTSAQDLEINNKCTYSMGKAVFTCSDLYRVSSNIENFLTPDTRMLVIKNSDRVLFQPLHHNTTNYRYVINYNILYNKNLDINECAFCGMTQLQYMRINGNFLPVLKNDSFKNLDKLHLLSLSQNNITTLEKKSLDGLKELLILDIAENNIEKVTSNLFKDLNKLKSLNLEHNKIKVIEENGFSGLLRLEILDLRFNNLKIVDSKNFNTLRKLHTLYLSFNKIESIVGDLILNQLLFLSIDNNRLREIRENTFENSQNIQSLDLSNNELSDITNKPFQNLTFLKLLNLKNNNYVNTSYFDNLKQHVLLVV